jgi:hypothetical protein
MYIYIVWLFVIDVEIDGTCMFLIKCKSSFHDMNNVMYFMDD